MMFYDFGAPQKQEWMNFLIKNHCPKGLPHNGYTKGGIGVEEFLFVFEILQIHPMKEREHDMVETMALLFEINHFNRNSTNRIPEYTTKMYKVEFFLCFLLFFHSVCSSFSELSDSIQCYKMY